MLINWILREADTDVDPQGGASNGKVRASDVLEQFGRDAIRLAEKLADVQSDNYRLRDERRTLKRDLEEARGKAPAADTRVLTADEATAYTAYVALGKPADLKTALDTKGTAEQELSVLKREKHIVGVADAAGYVAPVLAQLAGDLDIQVRPVKDGAPLVVVVADGQETALTDYAQTHWKPFLPALQAHSNLAPDINAGARNGQNSTTITDDERKAAQRRYSATF